MEARKRGFRSAARGQEEPPESYVSTYSGKRVSRPPLAGNTDKRVTGRDASRKVFKKRILRLSWHREQGAPGPPKTARPKGGRGACPGHRRDRRQLRKRGQDSDVRGQVGASIVRCVTRDGPGRSSSRPRRRTARAPQQAAGAKPPPCLLTVPGDAARSLRETAPAPRGQAHPASSGTRSVRPAGGHADRTHGPGGAGVGCRARRGPPGAPTRC